MMRRGLVWVALAGCSDGSDGTAVGNPGEMDVVLVGVPPDVQLRQADFAVAAIELVGCERRVQVLQVNTVFDALAPSPVELPAGEWCDTIVLPAGKDSLVIAGQDAIGDFGVVLSPDPFALEGDYVVDGNTILITLALRPEVLTAAEIDGDPLPLEDGATLDTDLVVAEGLYVDENRDYIADEQELAAVLADGPVCGCASTATPASWLFLIAGIAGTLRRRRGARTP